MLCAALCGACCIEEPGAAPFAAALESAQAPRSEPAPAPPSEARDDDAWRLRERSDDEVARYLPLDESLRGYAVQLGDGPQRAQSRGLALPLGRLFALDVRVDHRKFDIGLEGATRLEVFHSLFPDFGGAGAWLNDEADNSSLGDLPILPQE
ncbi:MAG: hypothetical protein EPO68_16305 [Planctomycetota bacterium]|nr:MAG: hypothetical protein EPO68_16305 [Planctomycetota bacterium]